MEQRISVVMDSNELDRWGNPIEEEPIIYDARVDEGSYLVSSKIGGMKSSENVVASVKILLEGLVNIKYTYTISYTNELDETISGNPKQVNIKRMIDGEPVLTEVFL
jgi:hypothetical protein